MNMIIKINGFDITLILSIIGCILMLIDTYQTYKIITINVECEGNPFLRWIYINFGMITLMMYKIILSLIPFYDALVAIFMIIGYTYTTIHNYYYLKNYETNNCVY